MLLLLKRLLENPVKRDSPEGGIIMSSTELFAVKILREVLNYDIIFPDEVFPFLDSSLYSKYLELPHRDFFPFINGAICGNFALIPTSPSPISLFDHCSIGNNVCIASGTSLINTDVPDNTIVMGLYPNYIFKDNKKDIFERPPFKYDF